MKYKYNGQWYNLSCSLNVSNLLIGEIIEYAGESIPGGYLVCDGSAVSRTEYSELFDVIGTLYGSGDGSTTFNLPDLRGKVVTGLNTTNSNFNVLGKMGGEEAHTLTVSEIPSHNHTITTFRQYQDGASTDSTKIGRTIPAADGGDVSSITSNQTGGGQAHNNLQPYITINYLIRAKKTKNVLASGSTVVNSLSGDSTVDAPSVRAVNKGIENAINEVNSKFNYSTEEVVIGTWTDGKPLYSKTVGFTTGSSADTWSTISGLTNINDIPYYSGYIYVSDTETFLVPSPNANNCPYFSINKSSHTVREAHTNPACNNKTCVITFNYTKTTDTVS